MVAILDHMTALADPIRCRMLMLLEKHELTVSELCAVLQMPQSSVSRHLKTLADDDWVASRRDGTSRFYSMSRPRSDCTRLTASGYGSRGLLACDNSQPPTSVASPTPKFPGDHIGSCDWDLATPLCSSPRKSPDP